MKKIITALTLVLAVGISYAAFDVAARGWNSDPANDPAFSKFLEETADIRKEIAMDRAELNALMAGDNPDPVRVRDLTGSITDNQEKLSEMARAADIGAPGTGRGGCGGPRNGKGSCGTCTSGQGGFGGPGAGGGYGSCGTPGCPGSGPVK